MKPSLELDLIHASIVISPEAVTALVIFDASAPKIETFPTNI